MNIEIRERKPKDALSDKPKSCLKEELGIRRDLLDQGVEREVANAVVGYTLNKIPFIYCTTPISVQYDRGQGSGESSIWIGTTDAIYNLENPLKVDNQIPELIVQWDGDRMRQSGKTEISRTEIKPLSRGRYLRMGYRGVSEMGAMDGRIDHINLLSPTEKSNTLSGKEFWHYDMQSFSVQEIDERFLTPKDWSKCYWRPPNLNSGNNISGSTLLTGYNRIRNSHMHDVSPVKEDFNNAYRFTESPTTITVSDQTSSATPPSKQELIIQDENPDILRDVQRVIGSMTPQVLKVLAEGNYAANKAVTQMETDGILNYPEKINILGKTLDELPRSTRFKLAQNVANNINNGEFAEWAGSLQQRENNRDVDGIVRRSAADLLNWLKPIVPAQEDKRSFLAHATQPDSKAHGKVFTGLMASFVERYIEHLGQIYLRNSLK